MGKREVSLQPFAWGSLLNSRSRPPLASPPPTVDLARNERLSAALNGHMPSRSPAGWL